ncbi:hypothetical protein ACCO45_002959 [Purpureocillium lilacinum]|uniref:Uncharacterized protein n=1 Tax=Purpureocillium lilacinum TaxID=33203 RepID=A0ACC4E199_PURLI
MLGQGALLLALGATGAVGQGLMWLNSTDTYGCAEHNAPEARCGSQLYCEAYVRDTNGEALYPDNDKAYDSRAACYLDRGRAWRLLDPCLTERDKRLGCMPLEPWRRPDVTCTKAQCDPNNGIIKNYHRVCGTENYCALFNRDDVRKNPDTPFSSTTDCLIHHEDNEGRHTLQRGDRQFLRSSCSYRFDVTNEFSVGTIKYCAGFSHPFYPLNSRIRRMEQYPNERACLLDRVAPGDSDSNDGCLPQGIRNNDNACANDPEWTLAKLEETKPPQRQWYTGPTCYMYEGQRICR